MGFTVQVAEEYEPVLERTVFNVMMVMGFCIMFIHILESALCTVLNS
jgi:hypothetical protein